MKGISDVENFTEEDWLALETQHAITYPLKLKKVLRLWMPKVKSDERLPFLSYYLRAMIGPDNQSLSEQEILDIKADWATNGFSQRRFREWTILFLRNYEAVSRERLSGRGRKGAAGKWSKWSKAKGQKTPCLPQNSEIADKHSQIGGKHRKKRPKRG